jgi:hypothetical protein
MMSMVQVLRTELNAAGGRQMEERDSSIRTEIGTLLSSKVGKIMYYFVGICGLLFKH